MLRKILPVFAILSVLASCSGIKPLAYTNNRQIPPATNDSKKEIKFLDISSANDDNKGSKSTIKEEQTSGPNPIASAESNFANNKTTEPAKFSSIQLKYAQLLNTEVEQVQNIQLYKAIDDWYGTRYRLGGTSKDGIDCSAFVQTIFVSVFAVTLPRMAKDQYKVARRISRTELQEGDLLFFNTIGGVSHVGIYLQNNKFVHASVSGVMISDMFDPYYVKHFISAGRIAGMNNNSSASIKP